MPTDPLLITRWLYTEALWSARGIKNLSNMVPSLFQDKTDPPSHCWVGVHQMVHGSSVGNGMVL